jgi:hypothetical protein
MRLYNRSHDFSAVLISLGLNPSSRNVELILVNLAYYVAIRPIITVPVTNY